MITFTKVHYQNFLAAGNAPIEIALNDHGSTLIVGRNGAGKSTMSEAICFALFGRPLRNINKPKLVNSINNKDCLVELEFRIGTNSYKIRRGIKPNVFEIYENGNLIPSPASAIDYQTILETNILHLNYKSFMQVVVLGSASYVPFMKLGTGARRQIIEDLLDIEVFSSMNALTKDDLNSLRVEYDRCTQAQKLIGEQRKMAQQFSAHIEEQRLATIEQLQDKIVGEQREIQAIEDAVTKLKEDLKEFDVDKTNHAAALKKQREYEKTLDAIQSRERKIRKEREFYEEHDNCPTCEQSITEEFKTTRFASLTKKEEDATKAVAQCQALIDKYKVQAEASAKRIEQARDIEFKLHGAEAKLPLHERRLKELKKALSDAQQPVQTQPTVNVDELDKQLDALETQHAELSKKRLIIDAASMLLRDDGIKTKIVRHYLPIINKQINHYLNALDFPILFTLDEEFNEQIKSRHRDEFAYDSFSEGEKKRIDLALLLTWRAVARLKNSAATNLLILDEVFDSSLDAAGTEEFLKVIGTLEQDKTNVFVISHKTDQLVDKFAHTVVFEKTRGFSTIKG